MVDRSAWRRKLEQAFRRRNVVWLMGVRRSGKTVLGRSLPRSEYLDCELPRVRRMLEDPEAFLAERRGRRIVLDEVHRLSDPAAILKIAADHYTDVRILATGSSTLGASARFRDSLAGRKAELWLTPMNAADQAAFGGPMARRLLRGGLPPFYLANPAEERDFQEWLDAYWAKDILELFRLERRASFQRFFELLLAQSGGIFEASRFARPCEVSRTTISNYLAVLEATFVAHVVRPFSGGSASEIVAAPRVYGFDTGFVSYHRGWGALRPEDEGALFEHLVLNELHGLADRARIRYWRTKQGQELDFVIVRPGRPPLAIECKRSADAIDPSGLRAFRSRYPNGRNVVVAMDVETAFVRRLAGLKVEFVGLAEMARRLLKA